jgi:hypothetical protein
VKDVAERVAHEAVEVRRQDAVTTGELAEVHEQVKTLVAASDVGTRVLTRNAFELPEVPLARCRIGGRDGDYPRGLRLASRLLPRCGRWSRRFRWSSLGQRLARSNHRRT